MCVYSCTRHLLHLDTMRQHSRRSWNLGTFFWICFSVNFLFGLTHAAGCHDEKFTFNTQCQPGLCSRWLHSPCLVLSERDWNIYREDNNLPEKYPDSASDLLPRVTRISLYAITESKDDRIIYSPSFNLSFTVTPKTTAVLMTFMSIDDVFIGDGFYKHNKRYRLFLPNEETKRLPLTDTTSIAEEIFYSCLVGLDDCDDERAYIITLTAFSADPAIGATVTYNVTSYNKRFKIEQFWEKWKPTIMTAVLPGTTDIEVVFEQFPADQLEPDAKILVQLIFLHANFDELISDVKFSVTDDFNYITFLNNKNGSYRVTVQSLSGCYDSIERRFCPESSSREIVIAPRTTHELSTFSALPQQHGIDSVLLYSMCGLLGFVVLLLIFAIIYRVKTCYYENRLVEITPCCANHNEICSLLAKHIQRKFTIKVHVRKGLELDNENNENGQLLGTEDTESNAYQSSRSKRSINVKLLCCSSSLRGVYSTGAFHFASKRTLIPFDDESSSCWSREGLTCLDKYITQETKNTFDCCIRMPNDSSHATSLITAMSNVVKTQIDTRVMPVSANGAPLESNGINGSMSNSSNRIHGGCPIHSGNKRETRKKLEEQSTENGRPGMHIQHQPNNNYSLHNQNELNRTVDETREISQRFLQLNFGD